MKNSWLIKYSLLKTVTYAFNCLHRAPAWCSVIKITDNGTEKGINSFAKSSVSTNVTS